MTKHIHIWTSTVHGSTRINGKNVSRYQVCIRRGCKAKRRKP